MSLLDGGNETVVIFPQVQGSDSDGNPTMSPSPTGVPVLARVQPMSSIEDTSLGQGTETRFRVRPDRRATVPIGAWAAVEWRGARYEVIGEPQPRNGSATTQHTTAVIRRA